MRGHHTGAEVVDPRWVISLDRTAIGTEPEPATFEKDVFIAEIIQVTIIVEPVSPPTKDKQARIPDFPV
jgi:hypothetical protein